MDKLFGINISKAMFEVSKELKAVRKTKNNPAYGGKSKYATLTDVNDAIGEPCQNHGLVVMHQVGGSERDGYATVTTYVIHAESGESVSSVFEGPLAKRDPQGLGSFITYGKRYNLLAIFNADLEDDDGNTASAVGYTRPPVQREAATEGEEAGVTAPARKFGRR